MKKIMMVFILCFGVLLLGSECKAEDLVDKIYNVEVVQGKEKLYQRINTMAHTALLMEEKPDVTLFLMSGASENSFIVLLNELAYGDKEMDESTYNYLIDRRIDIKSMERATYYEPFSMTHTMYTRNELITKNNGVDSYLRVTYDSPEEYISMDIPYIVYTDTNGREAIEANPYKTEMKVGRGNRAHIIRMKDQYTQFYYLIVKAIEEMQSYEYDAMEAAANPPALHINLEPLPRVVNPKILNNTEDREIDSDNDSKLRKIADDFYIRYAAMDEKPGESGEDYAYFMFFGKDGITYRISCSRNGLLELNVYAGSGGFLQYTIPNLQYPEEIYAASMESDDLTLVTIDSMIENNREIIKNIDKIIKIFKKVSRETDINVGV